MTQAPFRETAIEWSSSMVYEDMWLGSDKARSTAWWNKLVRYGAWGGPPGEGRVGPPPPETLGGIAKLFGVTEQQVREMVVADWYGVHRTPEVSTRVRQIAPVLDALKDDDAELMRLLARRLCDGAAMPSKGALQRDQEA